MTLSYDNFDRLVKSLTPEGIESGFVYDANNNLTSKTSANLTETRTYDILDQLAWVKIDTRNTNIVRDANGNIISSTNPAGLTTKYAYDAFERITEKRIQDQVTQYFYDQNGNIVRTTDALGNTTSISYDRFDRPVSSTDALGTKTEYTYDASGNISYIQVSDQAGNILQKTEITSNILGKTLSATRIDPVTGATITASSEYDASGNRIQAIDSQGNITKYSYDQNGNITGVIDPLGNTTDISYDRRGLATSRKLTSKDGVTLETKYTYDRDGRKTAETNGEGKSKLWIYNSSNQIIQTVDEAGNKTDYTYDTFGQILTSTDSLGAKTIYTYDILGNVTSLTDANGNKTSYVYDSFGRLTEETLADGSKTTYEYNQIGNLVKKTDPNGTVVNNTYDSLGRLTKRSIVKGQGVLGVSEESYTYNPLGNLTAATDSLGNTLVFSYDNFGRLTSETQNGKTAQTGYDANSNITSLIYPSGKTVAKTYDAANRLTGITLDGKNVANYNYNSLTLDSLTLANGAKTNYSYDSLLRLKSLTNFTKETIGNGKKQTIQDSIVNEFAFSYDQTNNILSNGENTYAYDALNRLTSVDRGDTLTANGAPRMLDKNKQEHLSIDYAYDNLGNRTQLEQTLSWTTRRGKEKEKTRVADYTSNALNQYTNISIPKSANNPANNSGKKIVTFTYDKNGNLTQDSTQRYFYDYRNRLVKVESYEINRKGKIETNLVSEYSYDILGRRITKTLYNDDDEVKKIIRYTYSGQDAIEEDTYAVREEYSHKTRTTTTKEILKSTKENIYSNSLDDILQTILTTVDGNKKTVQAFFYQKNQVGSITAITDEKGKLLKEYEYDEFGKVYERPTKQDFWMPWKKSSLENTRLFTGREYDRETNLYYYRARYYSADLGRFLNRDPIGTRDNINLYAYVGNNPVGYTDGMGREKVLLQIVDIFNRTASAMDRAKASSWYNYIGIDSDNDPSMKLAFAVKTTVTESNIKVNDTIRDQSLWIDPINCNT